MVSQCFKPTFCIQLLYESFNPETEDSLKKWNHNTHLTFTGLPFSRQYEIPWLFQTTIKLSRELKTI